MSIATKVDDPYFYRPAGVPLRPLVNNGREYDLVLRLREARRLKGLSQKDAAKLSGVGEKTISSFETGERIEAMKLCQLRRLLAIYEISLPDFFKEGWLE